MRKITPTIIIISCIAFTANHKQKTKQVTLYQTNEIEVYAPDMQILPNMSCTPEGSDVGENILFDTIDSFVKKMIEGNIAFNTPNEINIEDTAPIQLKLSIQQSEEKLKELITFSGHKESAKIMISNKMEARLTGSNFQITSINSEIQAISSKDTTEWQWEVKPLSRGRQRLHLTISALFNIDGQTTPRSIITYDRSIDVQVKWSQQIVYFIKENWQWLCGVLLIPFVGWLWRRNKSTNKPVCDDTK